METFFASFAVAIVGAIVSVAVTSLSAFARRSQLRRQVKQDASSQLFEDGSRSLPRGLQNAGGPGNWSLDKKITELSRLSERLSQLSSEVTDEFTIRLAEVNRLKAEAADAENIAAISRPALLSAQSLVRSELNEALRKDGRADRLFQVVVAFVSFAAGVGATLVIGAISGR
ncbi:hypothetical protein [Leifsonia poae]|uniref:Uncharacterized protein n=1 Tax=Leifsonia poae TaxID=110933 RepID=A0A9W6HAJ5_9MICO|nr:hypothetical protein [Leifsonia poae]GLJ76571.1 hypothetical protein GCM10017584_21450 [Leifsonia poae]